MASALLPFQEEIVKRVEAQDTLLVLAQGLGLVKIVAHLLRKWDLSTNLVLLVGATSEEELSLASDLSLRLKTINFEMTADAREATYKQGGICSVTERIAVVDMLNDRLAARKLTGMVVLHAEDVTPTSQAAFLVRIYRNANRTGFLKAFSDAPQRFTFGISPLQTVLSQLKIRNAEIWPRFHELVQRDLGRKGVDVVEVYPEMTERMVEIQTALREAMNMTLTEIKRSHSALEIEDLTVDNALFRSFDSLVRRQLDPVWHKVGPRTKQLLGDVAVLRNLHYQLRTSDCVSFQTELDTLLASNASNVLSVGQGMHRSPWLFEPVAHTIFESSKKRLWKERESTPEPIVIKDDDDDVPLEFDEFEPNEDEEEMLRQIMHAELGPPAGEVPKPLSEKARGKKRDERPYWLPKDVDPVLEQQPKWDLLSDILEEIENDIHATQLREQLPGNGPHPNAASNTILVMCSSSSTAYNLQSFLSSADLGTGAAGREKGGHRMLMSRLKNYFLWKRNCAKVASNVKAAMTAGSAATAGVRPGGSVSAALAAKDKAAAVGGGATAGGSGGVQLSAALQRKEAIQSGKGGAGDAAFRTGHAPSNKRRRVRGGAVGMVVEGEAGHAGRAATPAQAQVKEIVMANDPEAQEKEAERIATMIDAYEKTNKPIEEQVRIEEQSRKPSTSAAALEGASDAVRTAALANEGRAQFVNELFDAIEFDEYFGLLSNEELVIVRPYSEEEDDRVLEEIRPKYIILYDPEPDFVKRIEVWRASQPGMNVRTYFTVYKDSVEEQLYLASIRNEKVAFERLIREKGVMAVPHEAEYRPGEDDPASNIRTISTRVGGGSRVVKDEQPKVIVDVREFRSSLPSLLHGASFNVIPLTISVGDYILTQDMCIERKSVPDLISSFNSGRLHQQCELMMLHYSQPMLLIEFDERRSFSLEAYTNDTRAKKFGQKAKDPEAADRSIDAALHAKLVLLALTFPRLRIIWSSSPYQTVDIFRELKENRTEPDQELALSKGSDEVGMNKHNSTTGASEAEVAYNAIAAQDILRALPGITTKNYRSVMGQVETLEDLVEMDLAAMQAMIGKENGKLLFNFISRDMTAMAAGDLR